MNGNPLPRQIVLLLATMVAGTLPAYAQAISAVHESERDLLADAHDGSLQHFDLIDAALISGGVTNRDERARWLRVRDARYGAIDLPSIARLPQAHRPAAILAGLHREILAGRYRPTATLVQETLATGDFNCVTATILYHDLCTRCGVPIEIIAQSGHVCSRLVNVQAEEIETTRRDWFTRQPGDAVRSDHVRRVISPSQLLGRVYYNRALAALEQRQFSTAIELLQFSLALDGQDRDARENLLAGLNNWALALSEAGDHAAAAQRIAAGLQLDAAYAPLRTNELHVHQQWVTQLCQEHEFARAIQILEAGKARRPEAPLFTAGQKSVYESWLKHCVGNGDATTAAQVLRQAQQKLGPTAKLSVEARPLPRTVQQD